MATFFCSDPHAFHGNILKFCRRLVFLSEAERTLLLDLEARGGDLRSLRVSDESVDRMNRGLVANINARVGRDDTLWCLGDWAWGRGAEYLRNARWFRDQIACRTINLVWGNHDDRVIAPLFQATYEQVEIAVEGVRITLNHYPMLTWNGQHHTSWAQPNIHLYGHVHALYQREPAIHPLKDGAAWPALDVGFDGHEYQVWSIDEIMAALRPKLEAFDSLKRARGQFDPYRGRGRPQPVTSPIQPA